MKIFLKTVDSMEVFLYNGIIMKKFVVFFLINNIMILYAQNFTDFYFGGDIGINIGLQEMNETYESILRKTAQTNLEIDRIPNFTFSLYAGYYGYTENIAIQMGIDFNINDKLNQTLNRINTYSNLSYSYISTPLQLRISRKITGPIKVGLLFGPYISWPISKITEEALVENTEFVQECTYGIEIDQFITYSIKYGDIIFAIKFKRDFNEKFKLSSEGINMGVFIQQNTKIVIGYEYHLKI
jgi:hypothetical protein